MIFETRKCPVCGKNMMRGFLIETLLGSLFPLRKTRYVCTNRYCKDYYKRQGKHKFVQPLIPGAFNNYRYEHWWDEIFRKPQEKNANPWIMKQPSENIVQNYDIELDVTNEENENRF